MSFKSLVKKKVIPGMEISIQHINGMNYTGKVIDMNSINPADFSLVMEDDEGDTFLMNIGDGMGVIQIAKSELEEGDEDETLMSDEIQKPHEPKKKKKKLDQIKVPPKKKSRNKNFKDIHAPK